MPDPPFVIQAEVEKARALSARDRRAYLQRLVGPATQSPLTLDFRARLFTALTEAHLWPPSNTA